jgi:1-acyl-sn-glycerol-3-phosphate acyltransferase
VTHTIIPAIDLQLFTRLLGRSTANTGPYRWQTWIPARAVRRLFRRYAYTGIVDKYFKPLRIIGDAHFDDVKGPAIFIANHTSFMDGPAMFAALPRRYRGKTAFPAAADRFFVKGRRDPRLQGWWFSLVYNTFPLQRGGGRATLAHADWLLDKGWSIGIFPEGARTSAAKLARFRMGPAILAVGHGVPVVPMYMEGLSAVRPKGSRELTPGPVTVRIGPPLRFGAATDVAEATRDLHRAVEALGRQAADARRAARAAESPTPAPAAVLAPSV